MSLCQNQRIQTTQKNGKMNILEEAKSYEQFCEMKEDFDKRVAGTTQHLYEEFFTKWVKDYDNFPWYDNPVRHKEKLDRYLANPA
jgi:hypothetical protein